MPPQPMTAIPGRSFFARVVAAAVVAGAGAFVGAAPLAPFAITDAAAKPAPASRNFRRLTDMKCSENRTPIRDTRPERIPDNGLVRLTTGADLSRDRDGARGNGDCYLIF